MLDEVAIGDQQRDGPEEGEDASGPVPEDELADGGAPARLVDGVGVPGAEEEFIRLATRLAVGAEEGPEIALQFAG